MLANRRRPAFKWLVATGAVLVSVLIFQLVRSWGATSTGPRVTIGKRTYKVKVAQTEGERRQGLSFETRLPQDAGELFIFDSKGRHAFWNFGMAFPLDLIYILDGRVVEIGNLPAQSEGGIITYQPQRLSTQVLEVDAGQVKKNGIRVGDRVEIKLGQ